MKVYTRKRSFVGIHSLRLRLGPLAAGVAFPAPATAFAETSGVAGLPRQVVHRSRLNAIDRDEFRYGDTFP